MKKIILFILLTSGICFSQTITYEQFLDVAKKSLNVKAVKEIRSIFPKDFVVTALDIGDFSGDNKNDFGIAIKPHRSNRGINVYLFCDSLNNYTLIHSDTLEFVELPIEIGFSISNQVCFLTQKLKDKNWEITGYTFVRNELAVVDHYDTDVKNIRKFHLGEEIYDNYKTLHSFMGYYDVNTLRDYKKNYFLYHPVYDRRRNLYNSLTRTASIDNKWKWGINDTGNAGLYGSLNFSKERGMLIADIRLNEDFLKTLDSSYLSSAKLFFDRAARRLEGIAKRGPKFRESMDEDIASAELIFRTGDMDHAKFNSIWGKNYSQTGGGVNINPVYVKDKDLICRLHIPIGDFNLDKNQDEMGVFVRLEFRLKSGEMITLTNSDGTAGDPSSYGRLLFMGENDYYGSVENYKFGELIKKLPLNGLTEENRP